MRIWLLPAAVLIVLACSPATMRQMQQQQIQANTAVSPNFNMDRIYTLAVLPPTASTRIDEPSDLDGLRDYAGMAMIQTGHFSEVERTRIDQVMREQEFGAASGVVDEKTAAQLGKVLGADAILLTSVVYTRNDPFFNDPKQRETEMNVRIVSASTAEVLYRGRGQASSFQGELEAWQSAFQQAIMGLGPK